MDGYIVVTSVYRGNLTGKYASMEVKVNKNLKDTGRSIQRKKKCLEPLSSSSALARG